MNINLLSNDLPPRVFDFINLAVELIDNDICTLNDLQSIIYYKHEILEAETSRRVRIEKENWIPYKIKEKDNE